MEDDLKLVVHKLPKNLDYVNVYCVADLHIGSPQFNPYLFGKFKETLLADPNGYVVLAGDLFDCGLKNSKTNIYEQTMTIQEQLNWLEKELGDIKDKILAIVGGNHSNRITKEVGMYPVYYISKILGIENLYRQNLALVKVNFGTRNKDRQYSYTLAVHHGGSVNKVDKFTLAIDGIDAFISGHTHTGKVTIPSKIVVDKHNENAYFRNVANVVCTSMLDFGGYALQNLYIPSGNDQLQVLNLNPQNIGIYWK